MTTRGKVEKLGRILPSSIDFSLRAQVVGHWDAINPAKHILSKYAARVRDELEELAPSYREDTKFEAHVTIRAAGGSNCGEEVCNWHHDCGDNSHYLLFWASEHPTELCTLPDLKPFHYVAGDLVLMQNLNTVHRMPREAHYSQTRAFFVIRLYLHRNDRLVKTSQAFTGFHLL